MSSGGNWTAGVVARRDILDQPERLKGAFWTSVALHGAVLATALGLTWVESHRKPVVFGDINGGGIGSVAVNPVARIPLPSQSGQENPVANDTQSRAPSPPPKTKAQARIKEPDLDALPLPSRNAEKRPSQAASTPNKWRDQQKDLPNQVYSPSGQRMASSMYGMSGGGDVHLGNNSPFGTQFGYYADLIRSRVAQNWHPGLMNPRLKPNPVYVVFTIQRDGSVPYPSVKITQSSGVPEFDLAAKRAIMDSAPFATLPTGFSRNSVDVEFIFESRQ